MLYYWLPYVSEEDYINCVCNILNMFPYPYLKTEN